MILPTYGGRRVPAVACCPKFVHLRPTLRTTQGTTRDSQQEGAALSSLQSLRQAAPKSQISRCAAVWRMVSSGSSAGVKEPAILWHVGGQRGAGDLRLYRFVQFYTALMIPMIVLLFPSRG